MSPNLELTEAGGTVTGSWAAEQALLDPNEKSLVDTLGSQLMTQLGNGVADEGASTYERLGQLVGTALATRAAPGAAPDSLAAISRP